MSEQGTIAYSHIHVYHIKKILQRNLGTIEGLTKACQASGSNWSMPDILKTSSDEIATCLRILDTEGIHA